MASQKTVNANSVKNDGGVVVNAGDVSENLTDLSVRAVIGVQDTYGTFVIQDTAVAPFDYTDPHGVIKAKSTNPFAYTPPRGSEYILMGAGDTNAGTIGGSGSTLLTIPGGAVGSVINKNLKTTQVGTYATRVFNVLARPSSGNFPGLTVGTNAGNSVTYLSTSGNYPAVDDAATTSRSVPGELTYRFGAALPTRNVAYKAKDSSES